MSNLLKEKKYTFQLTKKNPPRSANGLAYPPQVSIPSESFMVQNGKLIAIRYAVGESTIIKKDQSDFAETAPAIIFVDGRTSLKEREELQLEYLKSTIYNEANNFPNSGFKTKFRELDFEKIANDSVEKAKLGGKATFEFWKMQEEDQRKLKAICRELKVDVGSYTWLPAADAFVKRNPDEFLKLINNSQEVEFAIRLDYIVEAEERNMISFGLGAWSWVGGGEITNVARGLDKYRELTTWTFNHNRGDEVWARISGKLIGTDVDKLANKIERATKGIAIGVNEMDLQELIKEGKALDIISRPKGTFQYNQLDGEPIFDGLDRSNSSIESFLTDNPKVLEDLKNRISAHREAEDGIE